MLLKNADIRSTSTGRNEFGYKVGGKLFYSGKFKNTFFFPLENFVNTYARLTLSSFRMSARKEQS